MSGTPTPEQLAAANLVEVTTYQEIDAAIKNDQGPLRKFLDDKFPPVTQGYVTKPKVVPPAPTLQVGVNGATVIYDPTVANNDATCALAKALGAKFIRTSIPWNCIPEWSNWGTLFTSATDLSLNQSSLAQIQSLKSVADSYGLQLILCTTGVVAPEGTTMPAIANQMYETGFPFTPEAYASIMASLVAACPGLWIEQINEPDQYQFSYDANYPIQPSAYAELLQLSYPAMKSADPTCVLIMGPVANIDEGGQSGWTFRQDLSNALANFADFIDKDCFHVYEWPGNAAPHDVAGWVAAFARQFVTKPYLITETGWQSTTTGSGDASPEMTPALQATYLVDELTGLEGFLPNLEGVLIYCLEDYNGGDWGLVEIDGTTLKPSFSAVQALIAET